VITGGPGTGKTTIINAIVRILERAGERILLSAPTGRAAKRMEEATGGREDDPPAAGVQPPAREFERQRGAGWRRTWSSSTRCRWSTAACSPSCSRPFPRGCRLIFVGDIDQLPSVGPATCCAT